MNPARACATALLATALAAAALPAGALSLGAPQLESHLGEPLRLRIPLRDDNPAQGRMEVQVGRLELPAMAERPQRGVVGGFVAELRQERNAAVSELLIRSREPVREPVLHLMLELRQGDSQWLRQIDVLLDPLPVPPREIPATAAGPAVVAARPLPPGTGSDSAPTPQRGAPPSSASPAETKDAAANTAGDTAADTAGQRPAAAQPRLTLRRRPAPTTPPRVAQGDPWEVRRGDTLSGIAQRVPRPAGVSYARFMEALRLANPGAFETPGDVRTLRVGAQLRAPDATTLDRAASTLATAAQRPPSRAATLPASGGIDPRTQALFLRPGLFALQTRFVSWEQAQQAAQAGLRAVQQGEPARFTADWTLSEPTAADRPNAPPASTAQAPAAAEAEAESQLRAARPQPAADDWEAGGEVEIADGALATGFRPEPASPRPANPATRAAPTAAGSDTPAELRQAAQDRPGAGTSEVQAEAPGASGPEEDWATEDLAAQDLAGEDFAAEDYAAERWAEDGGVAAGGAAASTQGTASTQAGAPAQGPAPAGQPPQTREGPARASRDGVYAWLGALLLLLAVGTWLYSSNPQWQQRLRALWTRPQPAPAPRGPAATAPASTAAVTAESASDTQPTFVAPHAATAQAAAGAVADTTAATAAPGTPAATGDAAERDSGLSDADLEQLRWIREQLRREELDEDTRRQLRVAEAMTQRGRSSGAQAVLEPLQLGRRPGRR